MYAFSRIAAHDSGFTLIELMVVLVIGGILAAIAIPSFLGRANAAKQAEARTFLGTLNRAQQAYYVEHAQFTDNIDVLAISGHQNINYTFQIQVSGDGTHAVHYGTPKISKVHAYAGMSALTQTDGSQAIQSIMCETNQPSATPATAPIYAVSAIECAPGTRNMN
ncbi:MAG: prepilin-type N-terminal cleavage/methylation domain-containing protein [Oscillatoriales cyanobacterium C42_A2020_001]|nr:prepilin-type N-terminal cleavage/methylation domain-containing protein [Leptolyngbyaceae cyanobacterium C42_A2020_001]